MIMSTCETLHLFNNLLIVLDLSPTKAIAGTYYLCLLGQNQCL